MTPTINPYIAGSPVRDPWMFFGREKLFNNIYNNLIAPPPSQVVVLYGQRRMGKTSTLCQMAFHLPQQYIPVLLDLQGMALDNIAGLIWDMMQITRRAVKKTIGVTIPRENRREWYANPEHKIETFFDHLQYTIGERRLVLLFDETILIADKIESGLLEPHVFDFFSTLMARFTYIDFLFSIGSRLAMMKAELTKLARPAIYEKVGYLEPEEARALITTPVMGTLCYEPQAIDDILTLTGGQPYYTQLVCHELFNRLQSQSRDTITGADVQAIRPQTVELATAQLQYVWDETPAQGRNILLGLANLQNQTRGGASPERICQHLHTHGIPTPSQSLDMILEGLIKRCIITKHLPFVFRIDLFRHWILKNQRLEANTGG